ncbi:hypothetical protein AS850_12430 [Frondihabitans sp. 762G35]|uniref:hypothetical protein n=1 Tax=Frondihabitans sp. 762G35 TaxID=1446794 RepID=UPI000D213AE8|nr:hypothetical protein [Frondihabitans sp. 762G35]ARC57882.1 hypothetical protein AS850_12430 [Frondihabitans sp. 762G35]
MHSRTLVLRGSVTACVGLAALLGSGTAASAAPTPTVSTMGSPSTVAPVDSLHIAPDGRLAGRGLTGALVTVTDRDGLSATASVGASGFWFVPVEDLRPTLSVSQSVDGRDSQAVTWGDADGSVVAPVTDLHIAPDGRLGGRGTQGAVVRVTDATGTSRSAAVSSGFWFVAVSDLRPGFSVIQSKNGQTSEPVTFGGSERAGSPVTSAASAFTVTSGDHYVPGESPTITGTGTPGESVLVSIAGRPLFLNTTVSTAGTWSVTSPTAFTSGNYVGNVAIQEGDRRRVSFDLLRGADPVYAEPAALSVTSPTHLVAGSRPVFTGTGTAGDSVTVAVPGLPEYLTTTVGTDGRWAVESARAYPRGSFTVLATQNGDRQRVETSLTVR